MPSSYTQSLRLILPVTGELTGTWGDAVNAGLTELVEDAIAGSAAIAMANANVTLSTANEAADQARNMFLNLTGANTAQRDVVVPAVSKLYFVHNGTTGGFGVQVKTAAGAGVVIPAGDRAILYCNGTNVVFASGSAIGVDLMNAATAADGRTTLGTDVYKTVPFGTASGELELLTAGKTINTGTAAGTVQLLFNNTAGALTLTQGAGMTLRLDGTVTTGNLTLLPYGRAAVHWLSTTSAVVSGSVA